MPLSAGRSFTRWLLVILVPLLAISPVTSGPAQPAAPAVVTLAAIPPNISWGGRAVAVTVSPTNNQQVIVASESGGLFKTTNGGNSWFHIDSLPMFRITDVRYAPGDASVVLATGWSDSHFTNQGGIWRSTNGGVTWSKPATSNPPAGGNCPAYASAWGIAFEPGSNKVYVGTDCGLAISTDLGATWPTHVQTYSATYRQVHAAAAAAGGTLYLCSASGFQRSSNGGIGFSTLDASRSCSSAHGVAISPLEATIVFVARNVTGAGCGPNGTPGNAGALFEGNVAGNGTVSWTQVAPTTCLGPLGRDPWVVTSPAASGDLTKIDVWYSDGLNLYRRQCGSGGNSARCGTTGWTQSPLSHPDVNHMAFDPAGPCPLYAVHDGGIDRAYNLVLPPPFQSCLTTWLRNGVGPGGYNAQQIYDLTGQIGPLEQVDLYFGTQDNGLWASPDRGVTWPESCCNEGGALQVPRYWEAARKVTFNDYGSGVNLISDRYLVGETGWRNPLSGTAQDAPTLLSPGVYIQWKQPNRGVTSTLSVTTDWGNTWNDTPVDIVQNRVGSPQVVFSGDNAVIYQIVMDPNGRNKLVKILGVRRNGTFSGVTVARLFGFSLGGLPNIPPGEGALGFQQVLGVDPFDPNHLLAPDLTDDRMEVSYDGGLTWGPDYDLTDLVVGYNPISGTNEFRFDVSATQYGAAWNPPGTGSQVHAVAFDPYHRGRILVGTEAAGIFYSNNGGASWETVPGSRQITGITDFFFIENSYSYSQDTAVVATYGRGLWRLTIPPGTSRPFSLPDNVANLWTDDWIRDPATGSLVDSNLFFDPNWCPPCRFYVVRKGQVRDFSFDAQGVLIGLKVSQDGLLGSTADGFQFPPRLDFTITGSNGAFDGCPACLETLEKPDGVIKGFVLDGEGKLLAYIGHTGQLPGEDDLWPVDPIEPTAGDPYAAPTDPYLVLVTDHLMPQPSAGQGEAVTVYGFNFCSGGPCSPLTLKIGERLLADDLVPGPDGAFEVTFSITEPFGHYAVTAEQSTGLALNRPAASNSATSWLVVGLAADETDEEEAHFGPSVTFLPLAFR